ncbi:hypothetical protein BE20_17740 [Sorangium cellulosum]|nr:hypothetical protein BE20_17740 [Sorangium cellulosum]
MPPGLASDAPHRPARRVERPLCRSRRPRDRLARGRRGGGRRGAPRGHPELEQARAEQLDGAHREHLGDVLRRLAARVDPAHERLVRPRVDHPELGGLTVRRQEQPDQGRGAGQLLGVVHRRPRGGGRRRAEELHVEAIGDELPVDADQRLGDRRVGGAGPHEDHARRLRRRRGARGAEEEREGPGERLRPREPHGVRARVRAAWA